MSNLMNAYLSLAELATAPAAGLTGTSRVMVVPADDSAEITNAYVALDDFKTFLLSDLQAQVDALAGGGGSGYWPAPITFALTGVVTGSVQMDGSGNVSLGTNIADNALAMTKVNGLSTALAGLQSDIDSKTPFDPTADLILNKNTTASPLFGLASADGTRAQFSYSPNVLRMDSRAADGTLTNRLLWNFSSNVASLKALFTVMGLNVSGSGAILTLTDTAAGKVTVFNGLGQINTDGGTTYHTLWHDGNLDPTTFQTDATALGNTAYHNNINSPKPNVLGYWNPTTTNISGMDSYGAVLQVNATGAGSGTDEYDNQLCLGTTGVLTWRRRVNSGAWSTNTLWHSGNLTPSNFVQTGQALTVPSLSLFDGTGGHATSKLAVGSDGTITVSSTPSGGAATTIMTLSSIGIRPNVPFYAKTITADVGTTAGMALTAIYNGNNVGGVYAGSGNVTLGLNGAGLTVFTNGQMVGSSLSLQDLVVSSSLTFNGSSLNMSAVPVWAGSYLADSAAQLDNSGTYMSFNDGSDGKSWFWNKPGGSGGGFVFRAYNGGNAISVLDMSPTTTTASGAWTFASSMVVNGTSLSVNPTNEGHVTLGQSDVYLYGNSTSIGAYGASFGNAYTYTFSSKVFAITGTMTQTSDERLKTDFAPMDARPLWQVIPLETWAWVKDGIVGNGPRAQNVLKHAPEYAHEDKEVPIAEMLGKPSYEIKKALKRIADGEEMGTVSVDKTGLALEMVYAAGRLIDTLSSTVDALQKRIDTLEGKSSAKGSKK